MTRVDPLVEPLRRPYSARSPPVISPTHGTLTFQQCVGFFWRKEQFSERKSHSLSFKKASFDKHRNPPCARPSVSFPSPTRKVRGLFHKLGEVFHTMKTAAVAQRVG